MNGTTGRKPHTSIANRVRNGLAKLRAVGAKAEQIDAFRAEFRGMTYASEDLLSKIR